MATFSATIIASADDAQEQAGTVVIANANNTATAATHYLGFRFQNVTIPAGSTISAATLDVETTSVSFDDPDFNIHCENVDDAATFTNAANNISSRTLTTANTVWTATSIGVGVRTSPDFASAVQEVIDRAGWASGNDLNVILDGRSASTNLRVRAYDGGTGTYPTLNITYTAGGGGSTQPPRSMHQFRMSRD